jgi:hypothetical protein
MSNSRTFGLVLLVIEGLRLLSRLDLHITLWSVTKPGIGIVVVAEFALNDVCSSRGIAFVIGNLLRSCMEMIA